MEGKSKLCQKDGKGLSRIVKQKYRGLEIEHIDQMIEKVKENNNGTLAGLKISQFMVLIKKEIAEKWNEAMQKEKGSKHHLYNLLQNV